MVNQDELNEFRKTHVVSPMNSSELEKLEPLGFKPIRLRYGLKIPLNHGISFVIEKFEDDWWSVRTEAFHLVWLYNQFICDGIDSVIDFIHRANKGGFDFLLRKRI